MMKIEFSDEEVKAILEEKVRGMFAINETTQHVYAKGDSYHGLAAIVTIESRSEKKADAS